MLPLSSMTEQQRESQYLADIIRLDAERRSRSETVVDPDAQGTRDILCATHVTTHESLFPFSENSTTLMFIVASDPDEAQRERLISSLSLRNITDTATPLTQYEQFLWNCSARNEERFSPRERCWPGGMSLLWILAFTLAVVSDASTSDMMISTTS